MESKLQDFSLPKAVIGRFAIVKLWPDIKTAEDECIARIKNAAELLGIECVEINADGSLRSDPETFVSKSNVDFVIHLHYDTPKRYDAYSFVALWNPLSFYHEWGYARCSRNLTTHDDFLSCSSTPADDHVRRMIRGQATHLEPAFNLYHSTPDIAHPPSLGECKLFYAGINWEALGGGKSRHQEVLRNLDSTGQLRIYGPALFQGVKVWDGYQSYVKEVPFDGVSMIEEIARCGIALVLSSSAHKDSALMSNRLFESVAAGALVICDENPFAHKFFGDSLLYIDGRSSAEQIRMDIVKHIEWAKKNPEAALAMAEKAQDIFARRFTLTRSLKLLYNGLGERKLALAHLQNPPSAPAPSVKLFLLIPKYTPDILRAHLQSAAAQEYRNFSATLVLDADEESQWCSDVEAALERGAVKVSVKKVRFSNPSIYMEIKFSRRLGEVLQELIDDLQDAEAFVIVAPNEKLFSNHLSVLAGALQRDSSANCASTAAVLVNGSTPIHGIHELIDFGGINPAGPPGYGRFIFRTSGIPKDIEIALPHLGERPMAVLVGANRIAQQLPATIKIDMEMPFHVTPRDEAAENEIIANFEPKSFEIALGFCVRRSAAAPMRAQSQFRQFLFRFANPGWLRSQVKAIHREGLGPRLQKLSQRLQEAARGR